MMPTQSEDMDIRDRILDLKRRRRAVRGRQATKVVLMGLALVSLIGLMVALHLL